MLGPHRDDIQFLLSGKDVKTHASRGEQKSVLISLKLIEFDFLKESTGTTPVLLLDDVYSELDNSRQKNIFTKTCELGQTFITSTTHFKKPTSEDFSFLIKNGQVEHQTHSTT